MTTAVNDLFQPDALAHFVPTKYMELELTPLYVKTFAFPNEIRCNPLLLMYPRIQGFCRRWVPTRWIT